MIYRLYIAVTSLAGPVFRLVMAIRRARGKEDRQRIGERFGRPGRDRPEGALIWIHGASVGESLSVLPLIGRLIADRPEMSILVTTGTVTSATLMGVYACRTARFTSLFPSTGAPRCGGSCATGGRT